MSATPASRPIASLTALKSRSRSKTSVTSLMRSMKTNERILRNESCRACRTREEEHARARDAGGDVAQHVDLRAPRADRACSCRTTGTPPVSSDARIVVRTSTWAWRLRPRSSWPWVFSRRLSCATTRCTAARSCSGPLGSARSSSLSGRAGGSASVRSIWRALELAAQQRLEAADARRAAGPRARGSSGGRSGWGSARRPSARRMRCTSTPMTPEPSPWRPKAAMASRARSRMRRLVAVAQRLRRSAGAASRG